MIDLGNLEWWQAFIGIVAALGLSPAPWILGLAIGRIQFTAPAERITEKRIADLKSAHAAETAELVRHHAELADEKDARYGELKESRDYYRDARIVERDRADKVTDSLAEALELARLNAHLLESLDETAKDGTK